jgi:2-oxoglutarate ferredoxin oxidoreductase subunit alpha
MHNAFDLADIYRTPVMLLADGIIGQMMEPVEFHEHESRELPEKPWAVTGWKGDRPRSIVNSLYIEVDELQEMNDRLQARYKEICEKEVMVEKYKTEGAEVIICAYGTVARICKSAIALCEEKGVKVGLVRPITIWPFPEKELKEVMAQDSVKRELTVEISAGQMHEDVRLAINGAKPTDFYGKPGSYTPTAEEIADYILKTREA